ncbi:MAG: hypothetical protein PUB01_08180 [Desulfovibrionaceae bacterium]|nr:hypothetical protein [Desulfovibrionaceae bacterium]
MKAKRCVLTLLEHNEGLARLLGSELQGMGLDVAAHFWTPGPDAAGALLAELARPETDGWLVAGSCRALSEPAVMRGLSLALLGAQAVHGAGFPVVISPDGASLSAALPTPFAQAAVARHAPAARMVARLHMPSAGAPATYRLNVHCLPGLGIWLEAGPAGERWRGAFMGVLGCDESGDAVRPLAHGVGPAGGIPARCTLERPVQGMRMAASRGEFEAWGVHNMLDDACSYYVKLSGMPDALAFGPFPDVDDPEVRMVTLAGPPAPTC